MKKSLFLLLAAMFLAMMVGASIREYRFDAARSSSRLSTAERAALYAELDDEVLADMFIDKGFDSTKDLYEVYIASIKNSYIEEVGEEGAADFTASSFSEVTVETVYAMAEIYRFHFIIESRGVRMQVSATVDVTGEGLFEVIDAETTRVPVDGT